jgi:hypothetical protein
MGGPGSGNRHHWWRKPKKAVVEGRETLDINRWKREGILKSGTRQSGMLEWSFVSGRSSQIGFKVDMTHTSNAFVELSYQIGDVPVRYWIDLVATVPNFGGVRWWFVCPIVRPACLGRAAKLYLASPSRHFGCRECQGLTYTSCQQSRRFDELHQHMARNMGVDVRSVKDAMKRARRGLWVERFQG